MAEKDRLRPGMFFTRHGRENVLLQWQNLITFLANTADHVSLPNPLSFLTDPLN